jgi:predicted dehydrogenase
MVKVGIVGLGKMGLLHAGILNALPCCEVTSVAEKEGILVRFAKKLLPGMKFYPSAEEMLARENELDAVYVTTPITTHLPIVQDIVTNRKKIGVFVEKPLAGKYDDAKKIADLSEGLGLQTMVGFQKRFSPIFQRGRKMLIEGVIGEVDSFDAYSYVSGVFSDGKGWRFTAGEGGALLDLGPHVVDILLWYFGEPTSVEGNTRSVYSTEVDDFASGRLGFGSGVVGSLNVSWSVEGYRLPEIGIEISGSNGKLHVTDDCLKFELYSGFSGMKAGKYQFRKPEFDAAVDFLIGDPEYCMEDKYFIDCVSGRKTPQPDFLTGLKVNDVIERIHDSMLGIGAA